MRSVRSILFGLVIVLAATVLLWRNEGRTLGEAQALAEGQRVVTSVDSTAIDARNEGKLIQLSGQTTAAEPLRDNDLGVKARGLWLGRKVEMLQWKETRKAAVMVAAVSVAVAGGMITCHRRGQPPPPIATA